MHWLRRIFGGSEKSPSVPSTVPSPVPSGPPTPETHDDVVRESKHDLTEYESAYIAYALTHETKQDCPDCRVGTFLYGPCGGCSQNVLCSNCGAEFNICFVSGWRMVMSERLTERGQPNPDKFKYWKKEEEHAVV